MAALHRTTAITWLAAANLPWEAGGREPRGNLVHRDALVNQRLNVALDSRSVGVSWEVRVRRVLPICVSEKEVHTGLLSWADATLQQCCSDRLTVPMFVK